MYQSFKTTLSVRMLYFLAALQVFNSEHKPSESCSHLQVIKNRPISK